MWTHPISPENVAPAKDWIALSTRSSVLLEQQASVTCNRNGQPRSREVNSPNQPRKRCALEGGDLVVGEVEKGIRNIATSGDFFEYDSTLEEVKRHSRERRDLVSIEVQIPAQPQHE